MKMGPFAEHRLRYCKSIAAVIQTVDWQLTFAETLEIPHYQVLIDSIHPHEISVPLCWMRDPGSISQAGTVRLLEIDDDIQILLDSIPVDEITNMVCRECYVQGISI